MFFGFWSTATMVYLGGRSCGYRGAFIIEDGKLAEKLGEKYARKNVKK
jgi:hypothetical protein